ncbi:MAG: nucleoside phosphorylase, partial [Actinomycetia bacterium]|nr:nucleoside phosphorylase [Actinomycetes bacterium]
MTFPNYAAKHDHEALFDPADLVGYLREHGQLGDAPVPDGVVFCYSDALFQRILAAEESTRVWRDLHRLESTDGRVGLVGGFGIGAPAAAARLEELIALGSTRFISIGMAGGLQHDLAIGDLVLCDRAVRDEGVSHHYLPPDRWALPDAVLTGELGAALRAGGHEVAVGGAWTIDTPYRETPAEIAHYRDDGVLVVEMEAAALFSV